VRWSAIAVLEELQHEGHQKPHHAAVNNVLDVLGASLDLHRLETNLS